jgi:ribonuclease HI
VTPPTMIVESPSVIAVDVDAGSLNSDDSLDWREVSAGAKAEPTIEVRWQFLNRTTLKLDEARAKKLSPVCQSSLKDLCSQDVLRKIRKTDVDKLIKSGEAVRVGPWLSAKKKKGLMASFAGIQPDCVEAERIVLDCQGPNESSDAHGRSSSQQQADKLSHSVREVISSCRKNADAVLMIDLKQAFYSVRIKQHLPKDKQARFISVARGINGHLEYYELKRLPMGWRRSPSVLKHFMRDALIEARRDLEEENPHLHFKLIDYMDDIFVQILGGIAKEDVARMAQIVKNAFAKFGFTVNDQKTSYLIMQQELTACGGKNYEICGNIADPSKKYVSVLGYVVSAVNGKLRFRSNVDVVKLSKPTKSVWTKALIRRSLHGCYDEFGCLLPTTGLVKALLFKFVRKTADLSAEQVQDSISKLMTALRQSVINSAMAFTVEEELVAYVDAGECGWASVAFNAADKEMVGCFSSVWTNISRWRDYSSSVREIEAASKASEKIARFKAEECTLYTDSKVSVMALSKASKNGSILDRVDGAMFRRRAANLAAFIDNLSVQGQRQVFLHQGREDENIKFCDDTARGGPFKNLVTRVLALTSSAADEETEMSSEESCADFDQTDDEAETEDEQD